MAQRTIDDVKADIDARWVEYGTLIVEKSNIESVRNVNVDLTLTLEDFLGLAEQKFVNARDQYLIDISAKNQEIVLKMQEIKELLLEARNILFDSNGVQYTPP